MTTPSEPEYRTIPLTKGLVAIVDATDYEWLTQWKWHASHTPSGHFYANRYDYDLPRKRHIFMHRAILGLAPGDKRFGDHVNGNTLLNTRANLRIVTAQANHQNARIRCDNVSGFKGVSFKRSKQKWVAHIGIAGRRIFLGHFSTPEEAHVAYTAAAIKLHGDFRRTA